MRSPGRPPVARREHRQRFWAAIARGVASEDAGVEAGVSAAVGSRWFRECGGMPPSDFRPHSGRYLSFFEREEIAICRACGYGVRGIARHPGRPPPALSPGARGHARNPGGPAGVPGRAAPRAPEAPGRPLRVRRAGARQRGDGMVTPEVMISARPAEAGDRAVPGHWEGDLIIGLNRSAIGTLAERATRFTMLLHLPRMDGYGTEPRVKNGPALAGHGAEAVRDAIAPTITTLPGQLRQTLTWDRGKEMAQHAQLTIDTGIQIYFADPHSPWQRGTNENTNGLLRQYFPKGTDLARWNPGELDAVAAALNSRPRKTLAWKTPAEALNEHLLSIQNNGVTTTP